MEVVPDTVVMAPGMRVIGNSIKFTNSFAKM